MTLVVVIFDGVALNAVFKFHRVDDVDLGMSITALARAATCLPASMLVVSRMTVGLMR